MSPGDPRDAIAEIATIVGGGPGDDIDAAVERALDALVVATGAAAAALFTGRADDPAGMALRARRGDPETATAIASAIRPAVAPRAAAALQLGEAVGGPGAADALSALGMPGGVVVPGRLDGRTAGALAIVPSDGGVVGPAEVAAARAVAGLLLLAIRNALLVRGLADRARELDRQALQLRALTGVARRLSDAVDEEGARGVVLSEARALVGGPDAVLTPELAGLHDAVSAEGGVRLRGAGAIVALPDPPGRPPRRWVLAVERPGGPPMTSDDAERLAGLAAQAGAALAHARLVEELRGEQAERRALAAAIVSAQEAERRRVAEDLHDGPVQGLVAVGLMLDAIADALPDAPGARADVARAASAAREAVRDLRRAMTDLHPMALEELGFAAAVRSVVERLEWRGIVVELDVAEADALEPVLRTVAYRIVQEALANVLRHAEAGRVTIRARREGAEVVLEVADDGRGIDAGERRPRIAEGHLGLPAIEERAALAGGRLEVESAPGRGTRLRLRLPTAAAAAQAEEPPMRSSASASAASSANRSSTTT